MEENQQTEIFHHVPHVQQLYKWDCGIACIAMVAAIVSDKSHSEYNRVVKSLQTDPTSGFGHCPWTIDLVNILFALGITEWTFFTTNRGVNADLRRIHYYQKQTDTDRVKSMFHVNHLARNIQQKSLSSLELINVLKNGPLITLVDGSKLQCKFCKRRSVSSWFVKLQSKSKRFYGHYIVVLGYSTKSNMIYYRNPSFRNRLCGVNMDTFNLLRCVTGTDQDIVAIPVKN